VRLRFIALCNYKYIGGIAEVAKKNVNAFQIQDFEFIN